MLVTSICGPELPEFVELYGTLLNKNDYYPYCFSSISYFSLLWGCPLGAPHLCYWSDASELGKCSPTVEEQSPSSPMQYYYRYTDGQGEEMTGLVATQQ